MTTKQKNVFLIIDNESAEVLSCFDSKVGAIKCAKDMAKCDCASEPFDVFVHHVAESHFDYCVAIGVSNADIKNRGRLYQETLFIIKRVELET